jgi:hypothetical protein
MKKPKGMLDIKFGDEASAAITQLGLVCGQWDLWEGGQPFQTCFDFDHSINVFEMQAFVRLIREGSKIAGLQLIFPNCAERWDHLRDSVRREFDLSTESKTDVYVTWGSGEAVHLLHDESSTSCTLTIAGAQFGQAYAKYLLGQGLGRLASKLAP